MLMFIGCTPSGRNANAPLRDGNGRLANSTPFPVRVPSKAERIWARQDYVKRTEAAFLDEGKDVYLSLDGKDFDILRFKYVLVSRPFAHQFSNSADTISLLRTLGFKKAILTDGYRDTWEITIK